jgi:hypothetical protein
MKVAVLNPRGNDPDQNFPDFAGSPDEGRHAPVNYHAVAACTGGGFYRDPNSIPKEVRAVILLLTHDLSRANMALTRLRREEKDRRSCLERSWRAPSGAAVEHRKKPSSLPGPVRT